MREKNFKKKLTEKLTESNRMKREETRVTKALQWAGRQAATQPDRPVRWVRARAVTHLKAKALGPCFETKHLHSS